MAVAPAPRVPREPGQSGFALAVSALAALLASGCCVMPLVLALAGVSGAWIGQLRRIEPWSPWLLGLSFVALGVAGWRLFSPSAAARCAVDGSTCASVGGTARRWFWVVAVLALVPLAVPLAAPWFY